MVLVGLLSQLKEHCPGGYAIALHIRYTTPKFLFQTYPKEWIDIYSEKGLVLKDPTVLWGFTNTGVKNWGELGEMDTENVLAQASAFGLKHGFTFALDDADGKSITSFARPDRDFNAGEIKAISAVVEQLHRATAKVAELTSETLDQLREKSIAFSRAPQ